MNDFAGRCGSAAMSVPSLLDRDHSRGQIRRLMLESAKRVSFIAPKRRRNPYQNRGTLTNYLCGRCEPNSSVSALLILRIL